MSRLTRLISLCLLGITSCVMAQQAIVWELPNGTYFALVMTDKGETIVVTTVTMIKTDPTPPTPVTVKGPVWAITIRVAEKLTADQAEVLINLRSWVDKQPSDKAISLEFAPDAVGPDGARDEKVAVWAAKIPANSKLPYIFISQAKSDGSGSVIHWQGELPKTANEIIAKIQAVPAAKAKK